MLSHRIIAATFPLRWAPLRPDHDVMFPTMRSWTRHSDGWEHGTTSYLDGERLDTVGAAQQIGDQVPLDVVPPDAPSASVHMRSRVASFDTELMSIGDALGPYFPGVPRDVADTYNYAAPCLDRFWIEYGESLSEFHDCIYHFKRAVWVLSRGPGIASANDDIRFLVREAQESLSALASRTQQVLSVGDDGSLQHKWVSTSLLSTLATMAMNDLAEGKVRRCEARGCKKAFASSASHAKFCSKRCQQREMKGRYRARKKANGQVPTTNRRPNGKKTR